MSETPKYPYEYLARYSFELIEPINGNHGGYATLGFDSEKKIESSKDWDEVAKLCFKAGEGKYRRVKVERVGEFTEEVLSFDDKGSNNLVEGQVIE